MAGKSGLFQKIRGQVKNQAKKISQFGGVAVHKVNHESAAQGQIIDGQADQRDIFDLDYQDIHQLFRHQFPAVTRQVFGKRYNTLNKVSHFVLPNGMDQAADEILEFLGEFAISLASTEKVLAETGSKNIKELQQDLGRSHRAGKAMKEVNKILAAIQGGLSGMTGLVGAAADLPISVILSLKTIYEIGHAYGFELDNEEDQQAVYYALSQSDLSLIAEKQTLFLGLRSIQGIFRTGDYHQLQSFLNSNYSFEQFQSLLTDEHGQYKWKGLNVLNKFKLLRYTTPLIGGAVGAIYNVRLIDEVAGHADEVFARARQYLKNNNHDDISALEAYHRFSRQMIGTEVEKALLESVETLKMDEESLADLQQVQMSKMTVSDSTANKVITQGKSIEESNSSSSANEEKAVDVVKAQPKTSTRRKTVTTAKTVKKEMTNTTQEKTTPRRTRTKKVVETPEVTSKKAGESENDE